MFGSHLARGARAAAVMAIAPTALAAQGGIVVTQKTTFDIAHISSGTLEQTISILGTSRSKTVTTGKMKVLIISSDANSSEILRLDQDQVITLDDKKKKYQIQSLAEKRAQLAKQQQDAEKSAAEAREKDNVRYYAVVGEARRTGEKQVINGFNTEQVAIKLTVMAENTKTGQTVPTMHLIADLWMDPSQKAAARINAEFGAARRQALGLDPTMASNPYAKWFKELDGELVKLEGFPIRSTLSFEAEVDSSQAADNKRSGNENPMGAIGGLFGKKKKETPANTSGRPVLFSSTSEVLSLSVGAPAASEFEIPAGYVKK